MTELTPFDAADYLDNENVIAKYLAERESLHKALGAQSPSWRTYRFQA